MSAENGLTLNTVQLKTPSCPINTLLQLLQYNTDISCHKLFLQEVWVKLYVLQWPVAVTSLSKNWQYRKSPDLARAQNSWRNTESVLTVLSRLSIKSCPSNLVPHRTIGSLQLQPEFQWMQTSLCIRFVLSLFDCFILTTIRNWCDLMLILIRFDNTVSQCFDSSRSLSQDSC